MKKNTLDYIIKYVEENKEYENIQMKLRYDEVFTLEINTTCLKCDIERILGKCEITLDDCPFEDCYVLRIRKCK